MTQLMLTSTEQLIREIIEHPTQEGGWKLTENPNDPDGGWTYAGVTSTTYNKYQLEKNNIAPLNHASFQKLLAEATPGSLLLLQADFIRIYYSEFYLPAVAVVRNLLGDETLELEGYELSCVVNVGLEHFEQIANEAHADDTSFEVRSFCYHWMMYYIRLVQKNAEAWKAWGEYRKKLNYLSPADQSHSELEPVQRPTTLRAEFLAGWFNRVEHWRGTE